MALLEFLLLTFLVLIVLLIGCVLGEILELSPDDLKKYFGYQNTYKCSECGYIQKNNFDVCPKCGDYKPLQFEYCKRTIARRRFFRWEEKKEKVEEKENV